VKIWNILGKITQKGVVIFNELNISFNIEKHN